jgi:betaine-aldehyde dehydrogenase
VATVAAAGEADIDTLATREALDIGRPAFEPWMVDLPHVVDVIRNVAGWADKRAAG